MPLSPFYKDKKCSICGKQAVMWWACPTTSGLESAVWCCGREKCVRQCDDFSVLSGNLSTLDSSLYEGEKKEGSYLIENKIPTHPARR